jgi:hypothetical protein
MVLNNHFLCFFGELFQPPRETDTHGPGTV